jgi:hypothetical protein
MLGLVAHKLYYNDVKMFGLVAGLKGERGVAGTPGSPGVPGLDGLPGRDGEFGTIFVSSAACVLSNVYSVLLGNEQRIQLLVCLCAMFLPVWHFPPQN